ncbi:hypothetical protein DPMN_164533 [Dreissena polymorpha]|uniref:Uncharacterized protein n=1 Tax=Dreissena polymorpha TaxID=45954 RepID=A0A9D4ISF4_DREPO|nr:hypothetical protein DPMN_164533 [Dreissena polymorpha]
MLVIQTELTPLLRAQPSPDPLSALPPSPCSLLNKTMHGQINIQKAHLGLQGGGLTL